MRGLLRPRLWHILQPSLRNFNSTSSCWGVDKSMLSKLRKQTGIPFINCKKALEKFDNDFDEAKKWLLEEAQKAGWARATKLQSRPMSQGLVAVVGDSTQVTMLEVNCETDFVAKNEKFLAMVSKLAQECKSHFEKQSNKTVFVNKEELGQIASSEQGTLADIVALNVGNLGENMALRRGAFLRADKDSVLSFYVHPSAPLKNPKSVLLGKYGAVVEMVQKQSEGKPVMTFSELGSHLCQHIVGMNPKTVGEYSPSTDVEAGRSAKVDGGERDEGAKSIEGENAEDEGSSRPAEEDEEDELLNQEFLLDSSMSVGELVCLNGVDVRGFIRYACGEELEAEKES
ncbi:elongation factor Ts, mitochondrial [Aplysia californica]|uniref:Elongation factor Ts, mitochondrial n=1 Tax=Aplysia californica TaxID=6500 RepID=A0ABM0JJG5_APLCA|nr:elongation factor Ts, mitochondrial [Aplysia californica]